jgi:pimeloyl-ACP methyl ester carboxylesterase
LGVVCGFNAITFARTVTSAWKVAAMRAQASSRSSPRASRQDPIDVPVLVMHGEDDQICPFPTTGARSVKLLAKGTLKSYPGLPHGMPTTHAEVTNADLLAFIKA